MNTANYHLKPGTLLDERYRIEEVIGEGGFGITYSGICLHQNEKVAIKEFFWKDFVSRDCTDSNTVFLFRKDSQAEYDHQKKRFLKEARMISDFSQEPGIVHIKDYFEENQTAYIVMDFLEGQTLKKYIEQEGPIPSEDAFRLLMPLMETLRKVHSYGVIHRDISPDNLILGKDHTLTLIDFGAARDYSLLSDQTRSIILKGGYAPCEQYDRHGQLGPWTDIYALCGVLYFCITKNSPDDAFQRMLHDELQPPSALGIAINPALEKILMKALSVEISSRYQNMEELMGAVREIIRETDPKEIRRKWIFRIAFVLCLFCLFTGVGCWYYQTHLEEFKFRGVETISLSFSKANESSQEQYQSDLETLEKRIKILAGKDNYILSEEKNGDISAVMPVEAFSTILEDSSTKSSKDVIAMELWEAVQFCLARPGQLSLNNFPLSPKDIQTAEVKKGEIKDVSRTDYYLPKEGDYYYLEFTLTDLAVKRLQDYVKQNPKTALSLYMDLTWNGENFYGGSLSWYSMNTFYEEDYHTFYLTGVIQAASFYELIAYDLTNEPYENRLAYSYFPPATWEDVHTSMIAGENQVNEDEIPDPAVYLEYTCSSTSQDMPNGQWYNTVSDFKTLLDALGIPYAFGISSFQEQYIILKIPREDFYLDIMYMLTEKDVFVSDMGNTVQSLETYGMNADFTFEEKTSPSYHWGIQFSTDYEKETIAERTQNTLNHQNDMLYLTVGNSFKIAELSLDKSISDGLFTFSDFLWDTSKLKAENMYRFLYTMIYETTNSSYYTLEHVTFTDSRSLLDMGVDVESYQILKDSRLEQIKKEAGKLDSEIQVQSNGDSLTVTLPYEPDEQLVQKVTDTVKQLYQKGNLKDGYYHSVTFQMDLDKLKEGEDLSIRFFIYNYEPSLSVYLGRKLVKTKKAELLEILKTDDFYQPFTRKDNFYFYTN